MEIYLTDNSGFFTISQIAEQDPNDVEQLILPSGAVTVAPPNAPTGFRARWDGARWSLVDVRPAPNIVEDTRISTVARWAFATACTRSINGKPPLLSKAEAEQFSAGEMTPAFLAEIDAFVADQPITPDVRADLAADLRINGRGAARIERLNPVLEHARIARGWSEAERDALFDCASQIEWSIK